MLYKMSLSVNEIPPLFVQLDQLEQKEDDEVPSWNEKARWIRYEEQAEDVHGRWSKPHVATLPQTSIDELKSLIQDGKMMIDLLLSDIKEIADAIANELLDYFNDLNSAKKFAEILCLHHHHHHEKKQKRNVSHNNLLKVVSSPNFHYLPPKDTDAVVTINEQKNTKLLMNIQNNHLVPNKMKYQYSFTDAMTLEDPSSVSDFKENTKFKKKVHTKAEGASILVMPLDFVIKPKLVFLRLEAATELQSLLEVKLRSRFIVLIIGPIESKIKLYEVGRAMSTCLADDVCRELFYSAQTKDDVISVVQQFNRGTMVIPPSEWNPKIRIEPPEKFLSKEERKKDPELFNYMHDDESKCEKHDELNDNVLMFSKKPFDGLWKDIERKLNHYISDFTDFFNLQCLATTLYMYLVSLSSLVTFGAMIGEKTDNMMATMECILAGAICGSVFSLFSGQPLNIISATGPMLILESIIKQKCDEFDLDFMEFRLWTGLWTCVFILMMVMFNLSFLVKYITRFTEDSFAALVAVIFISDAIEKIFQLRDPKPKFITESVFNGSFNSTVKIAIHKSDEEKQICFYFSVILFLLTFFISSTLKEFRNKPYLPTKVRQILSDFAVLIAIVLTSSLDAYAKVDTEKLHIPGVFQPTNIEKRNWIIPFFGRNPLYWNLVAIGPALIATVLVFMDQQITAVIINRKEFKLKKGHGYHLDLFIICVTILINSILGLPWFVAATVLALTHINSLKMMSENTAPGERPKFMGVREQRGTTLIMSILIGISVLLTPVLKHIPMAVLFGVFMFMGVSALNGMQFVERVLILFMPAKYQPDYKYLRYVNTVQVHKFTVIQIISFFGLLAIKENKHLAILFPLLVVATCAIRMFVLNYIFKQSELFWLDDILPGSKKMETIKKEKKMLSNVNDSSETFKSGEKETLFQDSPDQLVMVEKNEDCVDYTKSRKNNGLNHPVKFVTSFIDIKETEDS